MWHADTASVECFISVPKIQRRVVYSRRSNNNSGALTTIFLKSGWAAFSGNRDRKGDPLARRVLASMRALQTVVVIPMASKDCFGFQSQMRPTRFRFNTASPAFSALTVLLPSPAAFALSAALSSQLSSNHVHTKSAAVVSCCFELPLHDFLHNICG